MRRGRPPTTGQLATFGTQRSSGSGVVLDPKGYPRRKGVESELPGLFFVGFVGAKLRGVVRRGSGLVRGPRHAG